MEFAKWIPYRSESKFAKLKQTIKIDDKRNDWNTYWNSPNSQNSIIRYSNLRRLGIHLHLTFSSRVGPRGHAGFIKLLKMNDIKLTVYAIQLFFFGIDIPGSRKIKIGGVMNI